MLQLHILDLCNYLQVEDRFEVLLYKTGKIKEN